MINFVKSGDVVNYTNGGGTTITSGSPVPFNGLIGIAIADILAGATGALQMEGMFELPMNGAIPDVGTELYWDTVHTRCDTDPTVGPFIGNVGEPISELVGGVRVILPENGRPKSDALTQQVDIPNVATANATDLPSAEALANQLKTTLNATLTMLRAAGVMA